MTDTTDPAPVTSNDLEESKESDVAGGTAHLTVEMQEVNKPPVEGGDLSQNSNETVNDLNIIDIKRSVYFPTDENIACYSEAPDPWKKGS